MTKLAKDDNTTLRIRDAKTGENIVVRGFGALKDRKLELRKGIDLTKPIAEQVMKAERRASAKKRSTA